jgi:hypothetical protein
MYTALRQMHRLDDVGVHRERNIYGALGPNLTQAMETDSACDNIRRAQLRGLISGSRFGEIFVLPKWSIFGAQLNYQKLPQLRPAGRA